MLLFYAAALIANTYADLAIHLDGLDQNTASIIAELYSIIDEIYDGLLQKGGVDVGLEFLIARQLDPYILWRCLCLTDLDGR